MQKQVEVGGGLCSYAVTDVQWLKPRALASKGCRGRCHVAMGEAGGASAGVWSRGWSQTSGLPIPAVWEEEEVPWPQFPYNIKWGHYDSSLAGLI